MFIISLHLDWFSGMGEENHLANIANYLAGPAREHLHEKPLVVVWRQYTPENVEMRVNFEQILLKAGIPVYEGLPRAAFVLSKLAEYHEFLRKNI